MGLDGAVKETRHGVYVLGLLRAPSAQALVCFLPRAPGSNEDETRAILTALRDASLPAHVVVLVPPGRTLGGVVHEIAMGDIGDACRALVEPIARKLGVLDEIDPWRYASEPLVLREATREAWYRGAPVAFAESAWAMVHALTRRAGTWTDVRAMCKSISPARAAGGDLQAAKETRPRVERAIGQACEAMGITLTAGEAKAVVEVDARKGYRLGVAARIV